MFDNVSYDISYLWRLKYEMAAFWNFKAYVT